MIQLCVRRESELYNPFDPTHTRLNDDVYAYLKKFFTEAEQEKKVRDTLQIHSDGQIDMDKLKQSIHNAVEDEKYAYDSQIRKNHKRALQGYIVGGLLSVLGFALSIYFNQIILEIISFIGSISVREAVMIQTKINPDIRSLKKRLDPICELKLVKAGES